MSDEKTFEELQRERLVERHVAALAERLDRAQLTIEELRSGDATDPRDSASTDG